MKKSIQTPLGVYTDDEVGIEMIESYANQRVIDELKKQNEPNRKTNWLRTMKASILLILKKITYAWYNIKSTPSINQKRFDLKRSQEIPEDEVQNCCKRSCID
tara:strand:- start:153 stop:461 length:309 start_codon:yes stop_codon:yes gene_type:complete